MPKPNNPPAFPCEALVPNNTAIQFKRRFSGMTLRDWFAGCATEQEIAEYMPKTVGELAQFRDRHGFTPNTAWARYQFANDMIAEREKQTAEGGCLNTDMFDELLVALEAITEEYHHLIGLASHGRQHDIAAQARAAIAKAKGEKRDEQN